MAEQKATLRIKDIMDERGIGRNELAALIGLEGSALSNIINNKANPTVTTLTKIANALGVGVGDLFEGKPAAQPLEVSGLSMEIGSVKYDAAGTVVFKPVPDTMPVTQENT